MSLTLKLAREKDGGVSQYVKNQCGLSTKRPFVFDASLSVKIRFHEA